MNKEKTEMKTLIRDLKKVIEHGGDNVDEYCERLIKDYIKTLAPEKEYEPYFGWCDVEGCDNEGANGGGCWRETGYWTVCSDHSRMHREGKPQPKMKQSSIDREKSRDSNGYLTTKTN